MSEPFHTTEKRGPIAWMAGHGVAANLIMLVCLIGGFIALRNMKQEVFPDIALDIIDEAASEFGVKKEMAGESIPVITTRIDGVEKMMTACKGKNPEKDKEEFDKLYDVWDKFEREFGTLQEHWGHRVEAMTEANHE